MKKVLLTQIPSADDCLNKGTALDAILAENNHLNFEFEVTDLRDKCIHYTLETKLKKQTLLKITTIHMDVFNVVKNEFYAQGIILTYDASYGIHFSHRRKNNDPTLPTPDQFKIGVKIPAIPISIVDPLPTDILMMRCIENIQNAGDKAIIQVKCDDMENDTIRLVIDTFKALEWDVSFNHINIIDSEEEYTHKRPGKGVGKNTAVLQFDLS